jgi:hypothetical protein
MTGRTAVLASFALLALTGGATAEPPGSETPAAAQSATGQPDDTLTLLSVDVRTLPGLIAHKPDAPAPQWRTSFGSERRSAPTTVKSKTSVDADIVLLQGVTDIRALRRWFPAGQWRLVASRQLFAALPGEGASAPPSPSTATPVPSTAVAVRLRRGLRLTAQTHLLELADALGNPDTPTAAATAVRVLIDNRETWAVSVLLPEACTTACPGRDALHRWLASRTAENVRIVTGGRFHPPADPSRPPMPSGCAQFGLRLDPAPPPPRQSFVPALLTERLGCAATTTVAK